MTEAVQRQRKTAVLAYDDERIVGAGVGDHPGVEAPGGLGEPRRPSTGIARSVNDLVARSGLSHGARRSRARSRRAQRRPDRERVRDAADAERPRGRAAGPAALRQDQGAPRPERPAGDPRQDAQLREVRRRPDPELADGGSAAGPVVGRAAGREGDGGAGAPLPALAPRVTSSPPATSRAPASCAAPTRARSSCSGSRPNASRGEFRSFSFSCPRRRASLCASLREQVSQGALRAQAQLYIETPGCAGRPLIPNPSP